MKSQNGKCFNCNSAYMNCFETCPNSPKERGVQNAFYNSFRECDLSDEGKARLNELLELKDSEKQMNRYNAQILNDKGEYHLQFETNSRDNFNAMEKLAQKCIDNKPRTNFDRITESVESLAEFIEKYATNCLYCPLYKLEKCKVTGWKPESELCKKELAEWLQKECEEWGVLTT